MADADLPEPRSLNQGDREAAVRSFVHPAERIDPPMFVAEQTSPATELFARLVYMCMPPSQRGRHSGRAGWEATFRRMVAIVYIVSPEVFEGMTIDEISSRVGLSTRGFKKQLAAARVTLEVRRRGRGAANQMQYGKAGA